ncbi:MAG: methyltransferase [Edaphocola sp.]
MPNDYFRFKQFEVRQDKCAMKVSTDACIQGAVAANFLLQGRHIPNKVMDIGTGTGLLGLMLAQAAPSANIIAIETDLLAAQQAHENFCQSPWKTQITLVNDNIQNFDTAEDANFDFIVCNPPFFKNHLPSTDSARKIARHDENLPKSDLAQSIHRLLKPDGTACVMYPATEWAEWLETAASHQLFLAKEIAVKPREDKAANRVIGFFGKTKSNAQQRMLTIYDTGNSYTPSLKDLLKAYYLAL